MKSYASVACLVVLLSPGLALAQSSEVAINIGDKEPSGPVVYEIPAMPEGAYTLLTQAAAPPDLTIPPDPQSTFVSCPAVRDKNYNGEFVSQGKCWKCPSGSSYFGWWNSKLDRIQDYGQVTLDKPQDQCFAPAKQDPRAPVVYVHQWSATFRKSHKCPEGSAFDVSGGRSCWSCPDSYKRTLAPVEGEKACAKAKDGPFAKATSLGKTNCPTGSFLVPHNGGECWSCPDAGKHPITVKIDSGNACVSAVSIHRDAVPYISK